MRRSRARPSSLALSAIGTSAPWPKCLLSQGIALDGLGKPKQALAVVDEAVEWLVALDGETHPRSASALVQRGALRAELGMRADAVADLEKAIVAFEKLSLEPGHLAGAKWALGRTLWKSDRARAKALIEEAVALFGKASASWAVAKADAEAWLRRSGGATP